MCTAITFQTNHHYFGRNLDLEYHYQEAVTIMPRNCPISMRIESKLDKHYAIIGMATIDGQYPLYYDATNEYGLSIAALNFPGNAVYNSPQKEKLNIAVFEFIPWLLGQCRNINDVREALKNTNIVNIPYSNAFPLTPLHWLIADQESSITVEPMDNGLSIIDNPVGVLTNNPPFPYHMINLCNYMSISNQPATNKICKQLKLHPYSNGMGGLGLPGDLSSASRFIRAVFTKHNSVCPPDEESSIGQFFHILDSVYQQSGCVQIENEYEKTIYTSCCNTNTGVYYYTTYENRQISAVSMHNTDLNGKTLTSYALQVEQKIQYVN